MDQYENLIANYIHEPNDFEVWENTKFYLNTFNLSQNNFISIYSNPIILFHRKRSRIELTITLAHKFHYIEISLLRRYQVNNNIQIVKERKLFHEYRNLHFLFQLGKNSKKESELVVWAPLAVHLIVYLLFSQGDGVDVDELCLLALFV